jgi:23S rRNA A1618 N6-methylase RlmF
MRALAKALLKVDFNLDLVLPESRLCPTVANRYNTSTSMSFLMTKTGLFAFD